jgi:hypothetical protein
VCFLRQISKIEQVQSIAALVQSIAQRLNVNFCFVFELFLVFYGLLFSLLLILALGCIVETNSSSISMDSGYDLRT